MNDTQRMSDQRFPSAKAVKSGFPSERNGKRMRLSFGPRLVAEISQHWFETWKTFNDSCVRPAIKNSLRNRFHLEVERQSFRERRSGAGMDKMECPYHNLIPGESAIVRSYAIWQQRLCWWWASHRREWKQVKIFLDNGCPRGLTKNQSVIT
jgi:hypothetical protein